MGNSATIISFPEDYIPSPIEYLWRTSIRERDVEEASDIIVKALRSIMVGVHLGLNTKPDYNGTGCRCKHYIFS